ncbi:MAG: FKBP-type peptidyl-prolyl cis-trans isomerase [Pseudomonadaceae bacterium]|nr:FKBP-type peptidyl-prolyl cis-trans isomerase [Pseudomonadaceae bacterium]
MTQSTFLATASAAIRLSAITAVVVVAAGCAAPEAAEAAAAPTLESDAQKASYTIGYRYSEGILGQARAEFGDAIDNEAFLAGVRDLLDGTDIRVSEEDSMAAFEALAESQQAAAASEAATALAEESAWLAENGAKDGVITTDSGLQYEILTAAEGAKPGPTDRVTTHYEGRLLDGTVFDSSYQRDEPATFGLNQVIPGWTEALQLMSPGAKYRLYVPSAMAYGPQGRPSIPPNSTLIFDVELISIGDDS